MTTATVSAKGQVVIPASIRRSLGIGPGCQLEFHLEGNTIRPEVKRRTTPTKAEDGFGMLVCERPGRRQLVEFDLATTMREASAEFRATR